MFKLGTFIDMSGEYKLLNGESKLDVKYGWEVIREVGNMDISGDVIKTYYNTPLFKVHLDKNILQSNNYYRTTFWVHGSEAKYSNMWGNKTIRFYIGVPPSPG